MTDQFSICFPITEAWEGWHRFSNDPYDPGGATWCGMTQRAYNTYRRQKDLPPQGVRNATDDEIRDCFRINYWDAVRGDDLPSGLDLIVYDIAINMGPIVAIKFLQQALKVGVDGQFGLETLGAVQLCRDIPALILTISAHRRSFWHALKTFWRYGHGWLNRDSSIDKQAIAMARS